MIRKRKTNAQQKQEWRDADQRALNLFLPKLAALKSFDEAWAFAHTPLPNNPGRVPPERKFYDNFGDFLDSFSVPPDSSPAERSLYLEFIKRIDAAGELKPGVGDKVKCALRNSLAEPGMH
ncbi:MAG: hypothetical protein IPM54_41975 [Polyangiaceae bacterium]|nr:hypothetical protein [Polyangiaceae bacterium]